MNILKIISFPAFCLLLKASIVHADNRVQETFVVPAISEPPGNVQTMWYFYEPAKYIHIEKLDIHVLGTESVSDWMMRESSVLIYNMVEALKSRRDREKFRGHQAFIITDNDPDLTRVGGIAGHRNTGGKGFSLFNEALVCTKAVDTIRPDAAPIYRAWDTPVHEFGHSIEHTLKLEGDSDKIFKKNTSNYNKDLAREYFAWATQLWFSSDRIPSSGRKSMPKWQYEYLADIFNKNQKWLPSQKPRKVKR